MRPYLAKVAKLNRPIMLIDAFAGPGSFEDGSDGSPKIICEAAEKYAKNNYKAIFVNEDENYHDRLSFNLEPLIKKNRVITIHGTAQNFLNHIHPMLKERAYTIFLYLDQFGLKDCTFSVIEPFFRRNRRYSTELVINQCMPVMHRLAAHNAVVAGRADDPQIRAFHNTLTRVFGGDYWKKILLDESKDAETKSKEVMAEYRSKILCLNENMYYSGSCPVRENEEREIKYYVTFFSRHEDALLLMNNIMCKAYNESMHASRGTGLLFGESSWKDDRCTQMLEKTILETVRAVPRKSRKELWLDIVKKKFMHYTESEFIKGVAKLVRNGKLKFIDVKRTGQINDQAKLYIPEDKER